MQRVSSKQNQHIFNFSLVFLSFLGPSFYSLIRHMTQSSKFLHLQKILTQHQAIKSLLKTTSSIAEKYAQLGSKSFLSRADLQVLAQTLNTLKVAELTEVLDEIKTPETIVAFPIRCTDKFTLFFVIVPADRKFNWHSHPKMSGITKCFHGKLRISAIDIALLQHKKDDSYKYPRNKMQSQLIDSTDKQTTSVVQHNSYNVHKIEALQFSAFFDLLVPDYPENMCQFYLEEQGQGKEMVLTQVEQGEEEVVGWDVYYQQLLNLEKNRVRTFILK